MIEEVKNKIHDLAVKQIMADYQLIKEKSAGETIYAFGLGIVGDITGFFSAGNTLEALIRNSDDLDPSDFWYISEWEYEGTDDNTLYEFLATFIYEIEDDSYDSVMKEYERILINALKTCDEKGIFGKGKEREEIVVFLQYADATDETIDDTSSKQVNPPNIHLLFKERWNSEKNNLTKILMSKLDNIS